MRSLFPARRWLPRLAAAALLAVLSAPVSARQEPVDRAMIERIRQEGTAHSKVGFFFDHFVTVVGPRLTGSPAHKAAADWARQQLEAAGLTGAHLEPWEFGRGWELTAVHGRDDVAAVHAAHRLRRRRGRASDRRRRSTATPIFVGDGRPPRSRRMKASLERRHRPDPAGADGVRPRGSGAADGTTEHGAHRRAADAGLAPEPGRHRRIGQTLRECGRRRAPPPERRRARHDVRARTRRRRQRDAVGHPGRRALQHDRADARGAACR